MRFQNNGTYNPYKTDLETLDLKKCKTSHKCKKCNTEISKGSFGYGGNRYWKSKVCLNCADEYFNNAINSVTKFLNVIKRVKKDLIKNKKKYQINNTLANI